MKKRNIIVVISALAAALILFAACGKNNGDDPEVSTVVGADGQVYEEVTEIQTEVVSEIVTEVVTEVVTDKKGEAVTDKEGKTEVISEVKSEVQTQVVTTVVTVTKPYEPTTTSKETEKSTSSSTTAGSTEEATTTYEDVTFPEGTVIEVPMGSDGKPKEPLMKKVMNSSKDSKQFYIDCVVVTGESLGFETGMPVKMYLKNNNMAFEFKTGMLTIRMVSANGKLFMVFPSAKAYYELKSDDADAAVGDVDFNIWGSLGSTEMDYVKTTKVKIKGTTYTCEEYADSANTNKYYFNSKEELKRIEIIADDGTTSIFKINTCSASVNDSAFEIPKGYTKLSEEKLQSLMGSLQQ